MNNSNDNNNILVECWNRLATASKRCFWNTWNIAISVCVVLAVVRTYSSHDDHRRNVGRFHPLLNRPNLLQHLASSSSGSNNIKQQSLRTPRDLSHYRTYLYHVQTYNRTSSSTSSASEIQKTTPNLYNLVGSPLCCKNCTRADNLCWQKPKSKFIAKDISFLQPKVQEYDSNYDPHHEHPQTSYRLIPRIVHQSWFKHITPDEHPNLSRLQNSWRTMGWEYRFYDDEMAAKYIYENFPFEIFQAYDALIPGAFKADFFRYCVLFIEGGVWADIDMHLQTNLDNYVDDHDGFIVPRDVQGHALHNALIMSAPGHPILAKAIEESTNMIRNRYTVIDIAGRYCPNPLSDILKDHHTLFLTGPGLLAYAMKAVLGHPLSVPFEPGEVSRDTLLQVMNISDDSALGQKLRKVIHTTTASGIVPGRTKILERLQNDMSETRYTDVDKNWIIAGTDIQDGYDMKDKDEHYSKTRNKCEGEAVEKIWGLEKVYSNARSVDEQIKIHVVPR